MRFLVMLERGEKPCLAAIWFAEAVGAEAPVLVGARRARRGTMPGRNPSCGGGGRVQKMQGGTSLARGARVDAEAPI
jgi:hypothetical protein